MKSYKLDLSEYKVDFERFVVKDGKRELEKGKEPFDIREELSAILRISGIYKDGVEMVDGVNLARQIKTCEADSIEVNEDELELLKSVLNKLIARQEKPEAGIIALGGPRYEELVMRVFGIDTEK